MAQRRSWWVRTEGALGEPLPPVSPQALLSKAPESHCLEVAWRRGDDFREPRPAPAFRVEASGGRVPPKPKPSWAPGSPHVLASSRLPWAFMLPYGQCFL